MTPKVLVTGVTGYIAGDAFHALHEAHPDYDYTLLVRSKEREEPVRKKYPNAANVKVVYPGDTGPALSLTDVLEEEAKRADIVLHTAESADDAAQATAILRGLQAANRSADNPAHWIHVSGTAILQWYDQTHHRLGQPPLPDQTYDDVTDISRLLNLPDQADHRDVDKIVLSANDTSGIKTAIVAPPTIYGPGRGPVNTISKQIPSLTRFILAHGYCPVIGEGKAEWDHVHIHDLSALFVKLVDAAVKGDDQAGDVFGERAYYFCASGSHVWGEVAVEIGEEAVRQGWLKEAVGRTVSSEEEEKKEGVPGIGQTWGFNSKGVASRARKYLGWAPRGKTLVEEIPGAVEWEGRSMGLEKAA